ncbi:MAG: thioredoxin [Candidatus Obscuribacterales bacterium]|nr:thioredoxin [Candidatus Obscuribacterales bacterium]
MRPSLSLALSISAIGCLTLNIIYSPTFAQGCPKSLTSTANANHSVENNANVKHLSDATFRSEVLDAKQPVLVDFYASWCGPCKMMAPAIENLSKTYGNKISVYKVDVDENPNLSNTYQIQSIPAIKLFKNGKVIQEKNGFTPEAELKSMVDKALK